MCNQALKHSLIEVAVIAMSALCAAKATSGLLPLLHVDRLANIYLLKHSHRHVAGHLQILLTHSLLHTLGSVFKPVFLDLLYG